MALVRGPVLFQEHSVTLLPLVGAYLAGGVLGGGIAGALLPLGRRPLGAMLVGLLAALPVCLILSMMLLPLSEWRSTLLLATVGSAVLMGPVAGLGLWYVNRS
jgi:hypothetical protein